MARYGIPAMAAAVFLSAPLAVSAQDFTFKFLQQEEAEGEIEFLPMKAGFLIGGRVSGIAGEVDPRVPVDYEDLFGTGVGVFLEGRLMWEIDMYTWLGGYVSAGWDEYEGKRDTDAYGDSLEPDGMEVVTVLAGLKWIFQFHPRLYVEGHAGIGVARYGDVNGTFVSGGVSEPVKIFESSSAGVFDVGMRLGYTRKRFLAEIGFGLRFQGSPDDADFDFDSSGPVCFALELAIGFQF